VKKVALFLIPIASLFILTACNKTPTSQTSSSLSQGNPYPAISSDDPALDSDAQNMDANLKNLDRDLKNVDGGLNDKQVDLSD